MADRESKQQATAQQQADAATAAADEALAGSTEDAAAGESPLDRLRGELSAANDRALRTQAELDNFRKRARREVEDERKYANLPLLRDLLPVMDNIQRAIAAAEKSQEAGSLLEGIRMVAQNLEAALVRHQCRRIDAFGKPFDPQFHEAISQQPSADHPTHTVLMVVQDGYTLHDRVVRPAQVIVSSPPPAGPAAEATT